MDLQTLRRFWRDILYSLLILALLLAQLTVQSQIFAASNNRGELEIVFLDVGQGDALLITTPDRYTLLVDSGEQQSVLKLLEAKLQDRKLQAVMVSHPHEDHLGLMPEIIEKFRPKTAFINDFPSSTKTYKSTVTELETAGAERVGLIQGEAVKLGCCVVLEILWPELEIFATSKDPNEWSTAFRLRYGDFTLFAGGDLYKQQEEEIARRLLIPGGQILKVNHHGSNTSSAESFVNGFAGGNAVIQVGNNKYGHPTKQVLQTLEDNELDVYTNFERGNITIYSDGFNYRVDSDK